MQNLPALTCLDARVPRDLPAFFFSTRSSGRVAPTRFRDGHWTTPPESLLHGFQWVLVVASCSPRARLVDNVLLRPESVSSRLKSELRRCLQKSRPTHTYIRCFVVIFFRPAAAMKLVHLGRSGFLATKGSECGTRCFSLDFSCRGSTQDKKNTNGNSARHK